jgi:DNA-binding CsgD family transcriptional regulator
VLTSTEEKVAKLVAEGHTNQEVADRLFMSVRTVEANLTKVYRKLQVRGRTELAQRFNQVPG